MNEQEIKPLEIAYGWGIGRDGVWHYYADRNYAVCYFKEIERCEKPWVDNPAHPNTYHEGEVWENPPEGAVVCEQCKAESIVDTEWTEEPTCPWCGAENHEWWDGLGLGNDGDEAVLTCGRCGGEYKTTLRVSTRFESVKMPPAKPEKEPQRWYFTFGIGSENAGRYEVIEGTCDEARAEMFRRHGAAWAFQYKTAEDAGVERWGLTPMESEGEQ